METWDNVHKGPVPEWVVECPYDLDYQSPQSNNHVTNLLVDRQVQAEQRETYVHVALRLESLEAVQNNSQWRLEFEPQTGSYVLHTLNLRRKGVIVDQLHLEKGRYLQREEGLDRLIIDGWLTYLLILEDVRVGDVLEWSYTRRETSRILPENCFGFFNLPNSISTGKCHFLVRFASTRSMKWKCSADWKVDEHAENGITVWKWMIEKYTHPEPEPHAPIWFIPAPLIEFSDCPSWGTVAAAVAQLWSQQTDANTVVFEEWVKAAEESGPDLATRIAKVIEIVQDDCRYLSINLEFGGQIPTPPPRVARRRYGDCKDLSFLLVHLLKHLGVSARPVLVHTMLGKTIGEWLPNPGLFNHVIVEFEAEGKRRWIDPTLKRQGGGAFNRFTHNYGLGLPVDSKAEGLISFPEIKGRVSHCELRETVLVDTTGANSLVSVLELAEGALADHWRNQMAADGLEEMSRRSLQNCANRFGWANRVKAMQYHDDRVNNRFTTVEVFEINRFLSALPDGKRCSLQLPSYWLKQTLVMPENNQRRMPFALPHPYHMTHIFEVEAPSLRPMNGSQVAHKFESKNPFFKFNRHEKTGYKYWIINYSVETTADAVPPDQIKQYREYLEKIWHESSWALYLPLGYSKLKEGRDFGQLPTVAKPEPAASPAAISTPSNAPTASRPAAVTTPAKPMVIPQPVIPERKRRRSRSSAHQPPSGSAKIPVGFKVALFGSLIAALIILVVIFTIQQKHKP